MIYTPEQAPAQLLADVWNHHDHGMFDQPEEWFLGSLCSSQGGKFIKIVANLSMGNESAHRELSNGGTLDENDQRMIMSS